VLLALAACSGSKPSSWDTSGGYNAALNAVANASSHKGGTIIFDYSTVPDSTDPGNTYHAEVWNLLRLYGRALVTYKSAPGAAGMQLVPDLASRAKPRLCGPWANMCTAWGTLLAASADASR
jgi:peptide/nickel transport system substrate-binding protein